MKRWESPGVLWQRFKKAPITIRAAVITSVVAVFCVVLAFALNLCGTALSPSGVGAPGLSSEALRNRGIAAIRAYFGYKNWPQDDVQVVWFDFASSGNLCEFYAKYNYDGNGVVDVFTTRQGDVENLLHRMSLSEELEAGHIQIDGKTFFLCSGKTGSGGYLTLQIYDYDGIGKPRIRYESEDFFYGDWWTRDNRVFLTSSSRKFELRYKDGSFHLVRYTGRLSQTAYGTHVLSFDVKDRFLTMSFDGEPLIFVKDSEGRLVNAKPLWIRPDAQILIDDNFAEEDRQVRVMVGAEFRWHRGFFDSLTPTKCGAAEITVSDSYETWYGVRCQISKLAEIQEPYRP
jgi:hypothetical protein